MRRWFGAAVGALLLAAAGGAQARQETEAGPVRCSFDLAAGAQAVFEACDADLKTWPRDDAEYRAFALAGRGNALSMLGRTKEAIADLDESIALRPGEPEAWAARGRSWLVEGDVDKARADLDRAITLKPKFFGALVVRSQARLRQKDTDGAIADARAAIEYSNGIPNAWNALVQGLLAKGDMEQVVTQADAGLKDNPGDSKLLATKAFALMQLGRADEAKAVADILSRERPDDAETLYVRGQTRLRTGDIDGAIADLTTVLERSPGAMSALAGRAFGYLIKGDHAKAMADADTLTAIEPASGQLIRGQILFAMKKPEEARAAYDASVKVRPSPETYLLRANTWKAEEADRRLADLDAALALDPRFAPARGARAKALADLKRYDEAIAQAESALREDPEDVVALEALMKVYDQRDEDLKLIAVLNRLVPLALPHPSLFNLRCWALATNGVELGKALNDCKEAIKLAPTVAGYRDSLGMVHLKARRWDEAIAAYDEALKLKPALTESLFGRGVARLRKGLKTQGEADLAAARALDGGVDARYARYGVTP